MFCPRTRARLRSARIRPDRRRRSAVGNASLTNQGGALPGAEVTVTQIDTGMTRFVITGTDGGYVFTNLPVGPYKLAAKLSGFSLFEQTGHRARRRTARDR